MTVVQVSNGNGTIPDQMGTFCLILYNPTGVSTIFDEIGQFEAYNIHKKYLFIAYEQS